MKLTKLTIENWGPHSYLECNLNSPIVGIIGANGKGKSCILQAISYAITGALPRAKETFIRFYDPEDPDHSGKSYKASVCLQFLKDNKPGSITRTIWDSGTSRKLVWNGETYTKQTEVDSIMEDIMGADKAALQNAVFIKQGELTELIKGTPATRQEIFRRLMNLNYLSPRGDDIMARIRSLGAGDVDVTENINQLKKYIAENEMKLLKLEPKAVLNDLVTELNKQRSNISMLGQRADSTKSRLNMMISQRVNLESTFVQLTKQYDGDLDAMLQATEDKQKELDALKHDLECINKMKSSKAIMDRFLHAKKERDAQIEQLKETPIDEYVADLKFYELCMQIVTYNNLYDQDKAKLESLEQQYNELDKKNNSIKKELHLLEERINSISKERKVLNTHRDILHHHVAHHDVLNKPTQDYICEHCGSTVTAGDLKTKYSADSEKEALKIVIDKIEEKENESIAVNNEIIAKTLEYNECQKSVNDTDYEIQGIKFRIQARIEAVDPDTFQERISKLMHAHKAFADWSTNAELYHKNKEHLTEKINNINKLIAEGEELKRSMMPLVYYERLEADANTASQEFSEAATSMTQEYDSLDYDTLKHKENDIHLELTNLCSDYTRAKDMDKMLTYTKEEISRLQDEYNKILEDKFDQQTYFENALSAVTTTTYPDWTTTEAKFIELEEEVKNAILLSSEIKSNIQDMKIGLRKYQERQEKNNKIIKTKEELQELRSLISREGLPAIYMQNVFTQLTGKIQEFLSYMGSNFTVTVDESQPCSFLFQPDEEAPGNGFQQELLSGGQAVRLALALLLASQQIILPEVGLLVLDEPTSHVDVVGVESMRELFTNLAPVLDNSDMQLIIVDHNEMLQTGFAKTIKL